MPRRKSRGWSKTPDPKTGRVRMMLSFSVEEAEAIDAAAGDAAPASWVTAKIMEMVEES